MNVYLDNIVFELQNAGGISVYWYELLKRMLQEDIDLKIIEGSKGEKNIFKKRLEIDEKYICKDKALPLLIRRYCDVNVRFKEASVFHSSYYRIAKAKAAVNITTVYDFTYEYFRIGFPKAVHSWQKKRAIENSDGIICISENTKMDLLKYNAEIDHRRIKVIYLAAGDSFYPIEKGDLLEDQEIKDIKGKKYILYVGDRSKYKNFKMAVEIVCRLRNVTLVIVGGGRLSQNELGHLHDRLSGNYIHFNHVDSQKLNLLYNYAFCFLYPSEYEGFGIPVLESMQAGCPVVTTHSASIPEVCGDAALMVKDICEESLIGEIEKLHNNSFRKEIKEKSLKNAKKYSWDRTYRETMEFYREVLDRKKKRE